VLIGDFLKAWNSLVGLAFLSEDGSKQVEQVRRGRQTFQGGLERLLRIIETPKLNLRACKPQVGLLIVWRLLYSG
jgi:hypothetical protein